VIEDLGGGRGWCGTVAPGALSTSWGSTPSGDGDGSRRGGSRAHGRGAGGSPASLNVGGGNSADESSGSSEELHCDYLLIIEKG